MRLIAIFCVTHLFLLWFLSACKPQYAEPVFAETKSRQPDPSWLNKDFVLGNFEPAEHKDFILIDEKYADRPGLYLHKSVYTAFIAMHGAAEKEGVELQIRSATRNFEYQKGLWENKWTGETLLDGEINAAVAIDNERDRALAILRYSSMPGTSRHHWGTDIDLNSFSNSWFEEGEGLVLYNWLVENASVFGFCQPYSENNNLRPHGYNEEKWHWSYTPLSKDILEFANEHVQNGDIGGFLGWEQAADIDVKEKYIMGINSECK